ncbi:MAG TPA: hypothetical protein VHE55_01765 [Fimbriimonadaceae bacterium]|nr:hypothetical protein [Fimbriimonadaceae bacterium]
MRRVLLVLSVCLATIASACLNDRDSLADEVRLKPDVIWMITGRFERNPQLYFEMRIRRVQAELAKNPAQPDLYDDVSVAYERLGKHGDAIDWIEKKRRLLEKMGPDATQDHDWYRYYANAGTFRVHDWVANRGKRPLAELKRAVSDIAEAIRLNPNAHFGREGYQLAALKWLLAVQTGSTGTPLARSEWLSEQIAANRAAAPDGIAGLIRLGGAWESPDIFDALAASLSSPRTRILRTMALLRRNELLAKGIQPIGQMSQADVAPGDDDEPLYRRLRKSAEDWEKARSDFMMTRLRAGRHPDTDPSFWSGYVELPKPELPDLPFWERLTFRNTGPWVFLVLSVAAIVWKVLYDRNRQKKLAATAI